jgi:hypothetical protein
MLRPEIMNRIRETNTAGLYSWLKANTIEIDNSWYKAQREWYALNG